MTTQRLRRRDVRRQRGQAMIEYLLLIAFIGFGSVAVIPRFSLDIANAFGALANDVAAVFPGDSGNGSGGVAGTGSSGGTSGGSGSQGGAAAAGPTGGTGNGNNGQNNGQGSGGQDNGFGSPNK